MTPIREPSSSARGIVAFPKVVTTFSLVTSSTIEQMPHFHAPNASCLGFGVRSCNPTPRADRGQDVVIARPDSLFGRLGGCMLVLRTEIDINASGERFWRVLTDFSAYGE